MSMGGELGHQSIAVARQGITLKRPEKKVVTERVSLADVVHVPRWRRGFFEPVLFGDRPGVSAEERMYSASRRGMGAIWRLIEISMAA
jgi:hypothetical protein